MSFIVMFFTSLPILIGCVESGRDTAESKGPAAVSPAEPTDPGQPAPVVPPIPETVDLTYYSLSLTEAPVNGWPTKAYTAVGSCAVYQGSTYCWDDGVHTLQWTSNNSQYGPLSYTYWGLKANQNGYSICHGGCTTDFMDEPTYISAGLTTTLTSQAVNGVLTQGTPTTLTCLKTQTELNCGSVVIEF